jgi:hypothetical protein
MSTAWRRCICAAAILEHHGQSAPLGRLTTKASSCRKVLKPVDRSLVLLSGTTAANLFEPALIRAG